MTKNSGRCASTSSVAFTGDGPLNPVNADNVALDHKDGPCAEYLMLDVVPDR